MLRLQAFAVFVLFTLLSGGVLAAGDNSSDSLWVGKIVYGSPLDIMSACDIQAEVVLLNYAQCPTQCNGAITVKGIGGTAPYTYRWADNLIAGASRIGMCPATPYWLTITDAAGCSKEFRFQIQTNGTNCNLCPFTITGFTTNPASCPDATDGSATVNTSLPGAYTYQWESFSGSTPSGLTTRTISNAPPGDYKVKVTSSGLLGCSRTAALTVSKKSQSCLPDGNCLKVSVSSSDESCVGACDGQINLQIAGGSGDYVSLWTTGAYSENSEYISGGLCEGDYTVTIVDRGLLNSIPLNPIDLLTYVTQLSNNTCIVKRITTHISAGTQACSEDKKCFHSTDPHLHAADNCYCSLNVAVLTSPASCINSGDGLARITAKGPKAPYQF
ncbi:MAG: SprB repeat-containing protein, partial [Bacteroidota bacterium]